MAKRTKKGARAENLGDFAGPDHDKETIEKLADAARKANEKGGHNSEPKDEVIDRNFDAIELALSEIDAAGRIMQKARAAYSAVLKTAKTDFGGSKAWVSSVDAAVKLKRQSDKGGTGGIVTEHRQIGRILRIKGVPLGTQFRLFHFDDAPADGAPVAAMDSELQGQHAGRNGEPAENNPFTPGSEQFTDWAHGWVNGQAMLAQGVGVGTGAPAH